MEIEVCQMAKKKKKKAAISMPTDRNTLSETFQTLEVDELLYMEEVEPRFKALMIKFVHFLRKETFSISTDALLKFFQLYPEFDVFALEEMKYTLKTLLVKSKDQLDAFDDLFQQFFFGLLSYREEQVIDHEKQQRLQQRSNELVRTREQKEAELQQILQRLKETEAAHQEERQQAAQALELEHQRQLEAYQTNPLTYHRKKEMGEKELIQWATNHQEDLEKRFASLEIPSEVQEVLSEFFRGDQSKLLAYFNETGSKGFQVVRKTFDQLMLQNLTTDNRPELNRLCITMATACMKCHQFVESKKRELDKQLNALTKEYQKEVQRQESIQQELETISIQAQQQLNEVDQALNRVEQQVTQEVMREIQKTQSLQHREMFTVGKNAVQLTRPSDLLDQQIETMNENQYDTLTNYIKANATKFRTKLSRSMVQFKHQRFNYRKTMKESLKTFGTPMELFYEKPKLKKTKMVCILDVSGSCSKSSKLLLRFLYELAGVFQGGVYSYVFIRELTEVSHLFKDYDLNEAIETSLTAVPRQYSDYFHALKTFHDEYLQEVDRHTIVLYLGDARNNKNKSGVEYLEAIQEQAKATFWLNTEEKAKWNQGDSIIGYYEPYVDEVYEILTTHDLIQFLEQFKLN